MVYLENLIILITQLPIGLLITLYFHQPMADFVMSIID